MKIFVLGNDMLQIQGSTSLAATLLALLGGATAIATDASASADKEQR